MKKSNTILKAALLAGSVLAITASAASAEVLFWSTQAKPVEEAQAMRDNVLADAGIEVDYQPSDGGPWADFIRCVSFNSSPNNSRSFE